MGTSIKVYFILKGDFDPISVTKRLGVEPSRYTQKGEQGKYCINKINTWEVGTNFVETLFLDSGLEFIEKKLKPYSKQIKEIVDEFDLTASIEIVVNIVDNQLPGLNISNNICKFAEELGASIDIDQYLV